MQIYTLEEVAAMPKFAANMTEGTIRDRDTIALESHTISSTLAGGLSRLQWDTMATSLATTVLRHQALFSSCTAWIVTIVFTSCLERGIAVSQGDSGRSCSGIVKTSKLPAPMLV